MDSKFRIMEVEARSKHGSSYTYIVQQTQCGYLDLWVNLSTYSTLELAQQELYRLRLEKESIVTYKIIK